MVKKKIISCGSGLSHFSRIRTEIDPFKRVQVYRNLQTGLWSVGQSNLVLFHTDYIVLKNIRFNVGNKGRERVLEENQKNVHAMVSGFTVPDLSEVNRLTTETVNVSYNPYYNKSFIVVETGCSIFEAKFADMIIMDDYASIIAWE